MTHWAENYETMGRIRIISTCVTGGVPDEIGRQDPGSEDQQPGLVRRQHPQEQHGGAVMELRRRLDETGVHQVHTIYA